MNEKFAQWDLLFFQYLKRDWKKLIVWILGIGLFSSAFVPAFQEIAKGQGLTGMFETLKNPALTSMVGPTPIDSAENYTLGAMYTHEMLLFCGLLAMIVSILHVVGHTRKEEDLGLTELIRSFPIGRQANSLATMMETILINVVLALFISVVMISFDVDTITIAGSFLFGASVGFAGIIGAVIGLLTSQIMPSSSATTGAALGISGMMYVLRAGTDISNVNLSMINPMGWIYLTYPFTENNWLPLIFALTFSVAVLSIAFTLEGRRDMGVGYLPEREGRANAKKSLLSVHGLFTKLNKGVIIAWSISFLLLGAAYGSIYGSMQTFLENNELMKQMFSQSGVSIEASFTSTIMMVMISLVSILPIVVVNKLFTEERRSHLSQLYATKITRAKYYWTSIGLAVFSGGLGILIAAGSLGITAIIVMGDQSELDIIDFIFAGLNYLPAVLFFISLAAFALGWIPKIGKTIYIYLVYSFFINYFGNILDLPEWFAKTAIQSWIPQMPMAEFEGPVFITITLISLALVILGYLGYKRRDMIEGA